MGYATVSFSITGSNRDDTIYGGRGNDTVNANEGNDLLDGGRVMTICAAMPE